MSGPPIRTILSVENGANPFEVLGLPVGFVTEGDIIDALGERMQQVSRHPLSETPEGNEVRLALHAAAAQLLDSRIRAALLERAGVVSSRQGPPPKRRNAIAALGPRALMVIASEGGWNPRAMRRLAMLAHAEGIASSAIPEVVRSIAGEGHAQRPEEPQAERQGKVPRRGTSDRNQQTGSAGMTIVSAAVAIVVLAVIWSVLDAGIDREAEPVALPGPAASAETDPQVAQSIEPGAAAQSTIAVPDTPALDAPDWASALVGIRDTKEPVDAVTMERVLDGIADSWTDREPDDIRRIATAFVDVMYLMPPNEGSKLVATMADRIRRGSPSGAALYAGLLARLSIEGSLPTAVENAVVASMVSTIGAAQRAGDGVFVRGAARALALRAGSWAVSPPAAEPLAQWLLAADAIGRIDPRIEASLTRDALDAMLRTTRDPRADASLLRAIEALVARLDPANDPEASGLILRALSETEVQTRAASVLVNTLARGLGGQAPRLAPNATQTQRAEVREQLAASWLGDTRPDDDVAELRTAISEHLSTRRADGAEAWLVDAIISARLANGCRLVLWGAPDQALSIAERLRDDLDRLASSGSKTTRGGSGEEDSWAVRYLEAKRNIPVRVSLLGELVQQRRVLGTISAELIVAEAISGSPASVRREAQNVVMLVADQPAVVNATLELLPTVPRVRSVQDLVEQVAGRSLPGIGEAAWPFEARRAIIDRLLEVESAVGDAEAIDELAKLLAEEYSRMRSAPASLTAPAVESVRAIVQERIDEARRIDLGGNAAARVDALARMLAGRLALAEGGVSRYAAYQVTAVELLAETVGLEAPHLRAEAQEIVRELTEARLRARSVFEQIDLVERAHLSLWALRIGVQP